jgi:hypothetical protein
MSAWPSDGLMKNFSNIRTCAWTQGFTLIMHNFLLNKFKIFHFKFEKFEEIFSRHDVAHAITQL